MSDEKAVVEIKLNPRYRKCSICPKHRDLNTRLLFHRKLIPSGCWEYIGCTNSSGHAQTSVKSRLTYVHRISWEIVHGKIPEGMEIDHLCRNRKCFNPDHLEAVTPYENNMRGMGPTAINKRKTHCHMGHAFDKKNTIIRKSGGRKCRECSRIYHNKYYHTVLRGISA